MVSEGNVIQVTTKCVCGNGDTEHSQTNYFENKCPVCGAEGKLFPTSQNNIQLNPNSSNEDGEAVPNNNQEAPLITINCHGCGAEFCGQDGYDKYGGTRGSLTTLNPNAITDDEEDGEVSSTEEGETTYMSGWEGLCDLLKPLDGEALMLQRGDYLIVKKIEMPQTAELWAYEGINVVDDSVTITDYTPEIYNTFVVQWGETYENELVFTFDKHKNLFGERKIVLQAKKVQVVSDEEGEENKNEENTDENTDENKSQSINKLITDYSNTTGEDLKNIDTSKIDTSKIDTSKLEKSEVDANSLTNENGEETPETEEIPIIDREEAIQFGMTQVGKAKREDGHTVELKVIGNQHWQMGEWCHVRLPSFNEDSYMFISKCSFESSPDSEYINSLTLVDYPPSLGKTNKKTTGDENNTDENNTDENTNGTDENNTDGTDTNTDTNSNDSNSDNNSNTSN